MQLYDEVPDFSDRENSTVPPSALDAFRKWLNIFYASHPYIKEGEGARDYNLAGAFLAGEDPRGDERGHLHDEVNGLQLKKSNHISGANNGRWFKARNSNGDVWVYEVAPNSMYTKGFYNRYFAKNEPNAILLDDRRI